jgi:polysaccharide export outer membrane protein
MEAAQSRSFQRLRPGHWLPFLLILLAGCTCSHAQINRALLAHSDASEQPGNLPQVYTVACPDVLDLRIAGRSQLSGPRVIAADGRIDLGELGRLRVEGLAVPEIARCLAQVADAPASKVRVRVTEYNSRQIYLSGQVVALQRALAYQGPETVLDLLHRAGGISPGAAPGEVYVVRSHLADSGQPEVFRVDLKAILIDHDSRTNIYLQPLDQVFVGETRPCTFEKCIPPWMRPLYESVCGMRCNPENATK